MPRSHKASAYAAEGGIELILTVVLLLGQKTLTVPDMRTKPAVQLSGLGFCFLLEPFMRSAIESGQLVKNQVEDLKPAGTCYLAWGNREGSATLQWWIDRLWQNSSIQHFFNQLV